MEASAISIRGRNDGVSIEVGNGKWEELLHALAQRLDHAASFFRGGHVAVNVGGRPLVEGELKALCDIMTAHGMQPTVVRTMSERTFQSALALGISASHDAKDGAALAVAQPAQSDTSMQQHFVYRGNLRSGQILERAEHILIVGDINPGAHVISDGDIYVWGHLRGIAHAGAGGAPNAIIAALELEPVQLRIGDVIAEGSAGRSDSGGRRFGVQQTTKRPEIARLVDGRMVLEEWDEARVGGASILKRRPK